MSHTLKGETLETQGDRAQSQRHIPEVGRGRHIRRVVACSEADVPGAVREVASDNGWDILPVGGTRRPAALILMRRGRVLVAVFPKAARLTASVRWVVADYAARGAEVREWTWADWLQGRIRGALERRKEQAA